MNVAFKMLLLQAGVPAYRIAKQMDVSESYLSRVVQGRRTLTASEARRLAIVLSVPLVQVEATQRKAEDLNPTPLRERSA